MKLTRFSSVGDSIPRLNSITVKPQDIQVRLDLKKPSDLSKASLTIDGQPYEMSDRFGKSFMQSLGTSRDTLNLFGTAEIMERAVARGQIAQQRLTFEQHDSGQRYALALVPAAQSVISQDEIEALFTRTGAKHVAYAKGVIEGFYDLPKDGDLDILGERYARGFRVAHPLDGMGATQAMVTLMRHVCQNGMVADYGAFAQTIPIEHAEAGTATLERYLRAFSGLDAFGAFQMRIESARTSPASVAEVAKLHQVIVGGDGHGASLTDNLGEAMVTSHGMSVTAAFDRMAGSVTELYGVASFGDIPKKRQRLSPMRATVSDLMNFATEFSSHQATTDHARRVDAWLGRLITQEFDLEGTLKPNEQPRDLFITN